MVVQCCSQFLPIPFCNEYGEPLSRIFTCPWFFALEISGDWVSGHFSINTCGRAFTSLCLMPSLPPTKTRKKDGCGCVWFKMVEGSVHKK